MSVFLIVDLDIQAVSTHLRQVDGEVLSNLTTFNQIISHRLSVSYVSPCIFSDILNDRLNLIYRIRLKDISHNTSNESFSSSLIHNTKLANLYVPAANP